MSDEIKSQPTSKTQSDDFRWGISAVAGAGVATRTDSSGKTSVGPQLELNLGPFIHWGKNSLTPSFFTHFIRLDPALFGQSDPVWVKSFGAKVNYGRELSKNFSLRGQFGLGLAIYGGFSNFQGQNGFYTRETFVGPHFELGAGFCFFKDRLCSIVSYNYDVNAYTRRTSDLRPEFPVFTTDSSDAHGASLILSVDFGRL